MITAIEILEEPKDERYRLLLEYASKHCKIFSLVWRKQLKFDSSAGQIADVLKKDFISAKTTSSWPGTKLTRGKALVRYYRLNKYTVKILSSEKRLYAWRAPALPEDLALYDSKMNCWLVTVSHEHDAWIVSSNATVDDIVANLLGLKVAVVQFTSSEKYW